MDNKNAQLAFTAGKKFSDEQKRLLDQVVIIARDTEMKPGGQPYHRSYNAVDKKTGETIDGRDIEKRKDDVLRTEGGRVVAPEEAMMEKEGWGRIVSSQPSDRTWKVNANVGIRTKGDDALVIKLVETTGKYWGKERRFGGEEMPMGEARRWEYQISRKGQDASKEENMLKIPVFSNFGAGIYTEIGNKGSTYTSENMTTKNFQAQRVLRKADDIEIIVPPPTSYGVALAILDRDPFDAFAGKKALRGGRVVIPEGSLDLVSGGFRSSLVQLKGDDKSWGEITFSHGVSLDDIAKSEKANEGKLYAKNPIPQDELTWQEKGGGNAESVRRMAALSMPAIDGEGIIKDGATVTVSGNTGTGANLTVDGKGMSIPPHNVYSNEAKGAWSSPPVWLHGPGNKGSVDVSGLDGRIVISGGGKILTSQTTPNCWWYAEVILTGGSKTEKAVYTIEIPQFDDPKKKLDWVKKGPRDYKLERYPMQPYESIPLVYPDGSTVQMGQTENDVISIRGSNIEVRVKRGDQIETIYDSDKPELNAQSSLKRKSNGDVVLGSAGLAALIGADGQTPIASRRQFLAGAAASVATLLARGDSDEPQQEARQLEVREPLVHAPDPVSAPLSVLMPDLKAGKDGHLAVQARAPMVSIAESKVASRG